MKYYVTALFFAFFSSPLNICLAHEGHGHIPGMIKTSHGGVAKEGKLINLEMLTVNQSVQFFPLPHEGDKIDFSKIKITATTTPPKGKTSTLALTPSENGFTGSIDFKGSHRLDIKAQVNYQGHTENFQFMVEKQ